MNSSPSSSTASPPGSGLPVVLTRSRSDNARLAALLAARGLIALSLPPLRAALVRPADGADDLARAVAGADVAVFTSRRGVLALRGLLGRRAIALLAQCRLAAVGATTAALLRRMGLEPAWVGDHGAEELGVLLAAALPPGTRVLLLRAVEAPDVPARSLRDAGLLVDDRRVYRQVEPPRPASCPEQAAAIVCASPSAARRVLAWQPALAASPFVAIGRTTAAALASLGAARIVQAASPDPEALCRAVLEVTSMPHPEPR